MGTRAAAVVRGQGGVFAVWATMDGGPAIFGQALADVAKEAGFNRHRMMDGLADTQFDVQNHDGSLFSSPTQFEYRLDLDAKTMTVESDVDLVGREKPYDGQIEAFDGAKCADYVEQLSEELHGE